MKMTKEKLANLIKEELKEDTITFDFSILPKNIILTGLSAEAREIAKFFIKQCDKLESHPQECTGYIGRTAIISFGGYKKEHSNLFYVDSYGTRPVKFYTQNNQLKIKI